MCTLKVDLQTSFFPGKITQGNCPNNCKSEASAFYSQHIFVVQWEAHSLRNCWMTPSFRFLYLPPTPILIRMRASSYKVVKKEMLIYLRPINFHMPPMKSLLPPTPPTCKTYSFSRVQCTWPHFYNPQKLCLKDKE